MGVLNRGIMLCANQKVKLLCVYTQGVCQVREVREKSGNLDKVR